MYIEGANKFQRSQENARTKTIDFTEDMTQEEYESKLASVMGIVHGGVHTEDTAG